MKSSYLNKLLMSSIFVLLPFGLSNASPSMSMDKAPHDINGLRFAQLDLDNKTQKKLNRITKRKTNLNNKLGKIYKKRKALDEWAAKKEAKLIKRGASDERMAAHKKKVAMKKAKYDIKESKIKGTLKALHKKESDIKKAVVSKGPIKLKPLEH